MKVIAARTLSAVADEDVTDIEETAALPTMVFPPGEVANAPSVPPESIQHMERLIQLAESMEEKLAKIAKSLEKSPPSSPRKRKTVKSTRKPPSSSPRKGKTVKSTRKSAPSSP